MNLLRFLLILIIFIALNGYLFIRGRQALPDRLPLQVIYTVVFLVASLSVFIAIFLGNRLPAWLSLIFEQTGGYYMILFIFMLAGALLGDLLRVTNHYFHYFPEWITSNYPQARLAYFMFILGFLVIISLVGYSRFSRPQVVEMDIVTDNSPAGSDDLTIVAASDIHLGNVIRKERLSGWVELINKQKPDLILLAGDIFDHSYQAVVSQQMDEDLLRLESTYGVYAVPGNHDYYAGIDQVLIFLRQAGIKVLRDSVVNIDNRVMIIGRDDMTNRNRKTLDALMDSLPNGLPTIVLDHQPGSLNESARHGIDLHLSGHTHNGQIFPFSKIVSRIYELGYGYRKSGNTHLYVSSGLGLWGAPIRLGTQSEIVKIRFRNALN
jgi:predicted MPP superfamily phosphohydrolase